ncbi:YgfZ/GcvT domain-containing protein [Chloroflexota bacterium]
MTLRTVQQQAGAVFEAEQGIPSHYGDAAGAYQAALEAVVLVDRSDEGRILLTGADRLAILHRMSTNAVEGLAPGSGQATVLTTPVGRIIDRVKVHNLASDQTLVRTSSGRGALMVDYLRQNIFFRDDMQVADVSATTAQLMLYGPQAVALLETIFPGVEPLPLHHVLAAEFAGGPLWIVAADSVGVPGFALVIEQVRVHELWQMLIAQGQSFGLQLAGLQTVETLRIQAGVPGPVGELTPDIIPLEAGLWPDVSFSKGCYTGQEIIARMESRGQLAKVLVSVNLIGPAAVGTPWFIDGKRQGQLTSIVQHPSGAWLGLGFVKSAAAGVGTELLLDGGASAIISAVAERVPVG